MNSSKGSEAIVVLGDTPYYESLEASMKIWIALVVAACFWFLYNKTRHGKYMYAIGGNENAAQVAGVNVPATLIRIYVLASVLYALGGFLLSPYTG